MCMGGKSKAQQQPIPAPTPPTTFDYASANRAQASADRAAQQKQAASVLSSTGGDAAFGSELGTAAATPA